MLFYHYELGFGTDENGRKIYGCCCSAGGAETANDKFFNVYSLHGDKLLCVTRIHEKESTMEVFAAVKVNADGDKDVPEALLAEFPKLRILRREEVTIDDFRRNVDMMNFGGGRKILTKLKLDYRTDGLFNPCPSPEGDYLSCTEYLSDGKHRIRVIRTTDGSTAWTIPAPGNNEQLCETAWTEDTLYATAISDGGYTLWAHPADGSGSWRALAGPLNATMLYLDADGEDIEFVSDRSGVNELYAFNAETGKTLQLTSSRYGSTDFALDEESDSLYFTSQTPQGMLVFRTAARDLRPKEVDLCKVHAWRVADKLAQQEDSLAVFYPESEPAAPSAPKDYNKLTHLIKFHSWAPIYFNYDNVSSMSMDFSYETASLGLTGLFQNELGTAYGSIGYSAHKNPQDRSRCEIQEENNVSEASRQPDALRRPRVRRILHAHGFCVQGGEGGVQREVAQPHIA